MFETDEETAGMNRDNAWLEFLRTGKDAPPAVAKKGPETPSTIIMYREAPVGGWWARLLAWIKSLFTGRYEPPKVAAPRELRRPVLRSASQARAVRGGGHGV